MLLLFVGDVMLGRLVNEVLEREDFYYVWGDTLDIFRKADWRMCNLECVISDKGEPWNQTPKVFHFRSDAKNIRVLKEANIDVVSLANNHSLDYGYEAFLDMLFTLNKAGIKYAGAGRDIIEARKMAIFDFKNLRIGVIAFTDNEEGWEAAPGRAGTFYLPVDLKDERAEILFDLVKRAREKVDILIVSAHWGPNWGYRPQKEHIPFAHKLVDYGADIIFGHSCHVFQGIEIYKKCLIIYSAGDFIDDYAVDEVERNDQSFIFVVNLVGKKIENLFLYPIVIYDFKANLAQGKLRREICSKMRKLCLEMDTPAVFSKEGLSIKIY